MKKLLLSLTAAAVLVPGLAMAQTVIYDDGGYHTSYSNLYQDRVRIADDRATLSRDQDILARDRAFGNWWAISGDVWRVRQDRAQLTSDLSSYDADRGMIPRTYTYEYRY
jgi:hypothetical protein